MSLSPTQLGIGAVTSLIGKGADKKASNSISQWGKVLEPYLNAPINVTTPTGGFNGGFGDNGFNYNYNFSSPFRDQLLDVFDTTEQLYPLGFDIYNSAGEFGADRGRFLDLYNDVGALRDTVTPGFSVLRDRRLEAVEHARSKGMGDLRDSIARRRVAGSSFANDSISRAESEYGKLRSDTEAQTFLEELDANMRLISQQQSLGTSAMQALQNRFQTELGALGNLTSLAGIDASVAGQGLSADLQTMSQALGGLAQVQQFTSGIMSLLQQNANAQAELYSNQASGMGNITGLLLSQALGQDNTLSDFNDVFGGVGGAVGSLNPYATSGNLRTY